ncbi:MULTISPECIES: MarR family transcriptional regulator [unclassified Streptomyces]|uniref:MarR family transcriptional regulator n=1 Tax=unclassified Streptomyces TaxID=2593676 RepID=UPI002256EE72|nr:MULTISPECIES: MarR family transcriptional regulator [unclassified Streptomyces]MCX4524111.1 winged helix DNA-binding protein [Streptomyces sp. NBC_01551]MCX4545371.1 winged helix DNA-binding protein [Streptomyces sp. NBC_01565]
MEHPVAAEANGGAAGPAFVIIGTANTQTDWARVLDALTNPDPPPGAPPAPRSADAAAAHRPATGGAGQREGRGAAVPEPTSATPPSVLDLNAYLVYAIGKAARRRLTAKLTEHGLRLWHLTVLALLGDLGPQSKGTLANRLDMNASDLVKVVNDLARSGYVECVRDTADRRRVVVELTREGRAALARLNADISSTDEEFLAPLTAGERAQLGSLLRRVHRHFDTTPSHTVHEDPDAAAAEAAAPDTDPPRPAGARSVEALRIDWNRSAEDIEHLVRAQSRGRTGAYTHHRGRRLEILAAAATEGRYGGAPGRVVRSETDGLVIVAGPDDEAPGRGLSLVRVRTEGGTEMSASDYFAPEAGGPATDA